MQEFIKAAMEKFGTSEEQTKSLTGGLLSLIKGEAGDADFGELAAKVPGLGALAEEGGESSSGGGGLLGGALGLAASALGGKAGTALNLGAILEKSGLDLDQAGGFASLLTGFLKEKAGGDLVGGILEKVPDLKKLLG